VAAAQPLKVILFGSHARGDADDYSDVDLLVIEVTVPDRCEEMVRLNRALSLEHLLRYCARLPFALERLSLIRDASGRATEVR
jgi:predicted nucleotidyltransferase